MPTIRDKIQKILVKLKQLEI